MPTRSMALPVALLLVTVTACSGGNGMAGSSGAGHGTGGPSASASSAATDPVWVTARTRTGSQPCGILGAAGAIWVSDFTDGTLVRLDATTGRPMGPPLQVGAQPCGMAYGAGSI